MTLIHEHFKDLFGVVILRKIYDNKNNVPTHPSF